MFRSIAAEQLFNELLQRLPALLSVKATSVELNQGLTQTYDDCNEGRLESFVEPGTRKRNITGRSVARLAAEKLDAALAAGAPPKFTEKAMAASLASLNRKRLASTAAREPRRAADVSPTSDKGLTEAIAAPLASSKRKGGRPGNRPPSDVASEAAARGAR